MIRFQLTGVALGLDENMETWKQKRLCVSRVTAMGGGGGGGVSTVEHALTT